MSARRFTSLLLIILISLSAMLAISPQGAAQDEGFLSPMADSAAPSLSMPETSGETTSVTVAVRGLPSDLSTTISVDGKQASSMTGEGSKNFEVDKTVPHSISVDANVIGSCSVYEGRSVCTRYSCTDHRWNVDVVKTQTCRTVPVCVRVGLKFVCTYEQQCQTTADLKEKVHTFEYFAEHELLISDVHVPDVDRWYRDGQDATVSADEFVVTKGENSMRERDIFQDWILNGVLFENNVLTLTMDKPYYARAEYRTGTEYKVRLISEFGNPTLDEPTGWYLKGEQATVSVESEVPSERWMGAVGVRMVFVAWQSLKGTQSENPKFTFTVDDPVVLKAEWRTDYTQPVVIITIAAALVAALLLILYRGGRLSKRASQTAHEQTETSQAQPKSP